MYSPCFCLHNMMKTGMRMIKMTNLIKMMMVRMKMMVGMNLHYMIKIELKIITLIKITIMKMRTTMTKRPKITTVIVLVLAFFLSSLKNRKRYKKSRVALFLM